MDNAPFPTNRHGAIVYVDYNGDIPHTVVTTKGEYEFEDCDIGLTFYRVGGGWHEQHPRIPLPAWVASYWAADCVTLSVWDRAARGTRAATAEEIAAGGSLRLTALPCDPFDGADESEAGFVYCNVCTRMFDEDRTCGHLWWGESERMGPGSDDCGDECKDSFLTLCRRAGIVRALRRGLVPFSWEHREVHATGGLGPSFVWFTSAGTSLGNIASKLECDDPDALRDGASWLLALDKKTLGANERTKRWLDDEVAAQDARRASGEAVYIVRERWASEASPRMSWRDALARARALRREKREAAIVHAPRGARKRTAA